MLTLKDRYWNICSMIRSGRYCQLTWSGLYFQFSGSTWNTCYRIRSGRYCQLTWSALYFQFSGSTWNTSYRSTTVVCGFHIGSLNDQFWQSRLGIPTKNVEFVPIFPGLVRQITEEAETLVDVVCVTILLAVLCCAIIVIISIAARQCAAHTPVV